MKAWIGKTLIGIGIAHSIGGFAWFHPILNTLFGEGLFNTIAVNGNLEREAAFWFLFAGFALMLIGGLVNRLERLGENLPPFLGWGFAALTTVGAIIMPVSGFWLLIIPTIAMIRRRN
jgi:hypothetical protein